MREIKNIDIIVENGELSSAKVEYLDNTTEEVKGIDHIKEMLSQFITQTGLLYDELVRYNLIKIHNVKNKKESLGGTIRVGNMHYDLVRYFVPTHKLDFGEEKSIVVIADMHDYAAEIEKADALAKAIKSRNPHHTIIAGDNMQGAKWEDPTDLRNFRRFLDNVSESAPVFVSQGNHDLVGINSSNVERRLGNFKKLGRDGRIYPLVNDRVFIDGFEIIGYTPSPKLISSNSERESGLAHDKFIREYNERGVKPVKSDKIIEFAGHNPHLIACSANGIGLGELVPVDVFLAGHLHNGYYQSDTIIENPDKYLDTGYVERLTYRNSDGKLGGVSPFLCKTNLCRGVVYVDDRSQQRYLQLRNNHFYVNIATRDNEQTWIPCREEDARDNIINNHLHALVITGGIRKFFKWQRSHDRPEITEVVYKGTKR